MDTSQVDSCKEPGVNAVIWGQTTRAALKVSQGFTCLHTVRMHLVCIEGKRHSRLLLCLFGELISNYLQFNQKINIVITAKHDECN